MSPQGSVAEVNRWAGVQGALHWGWDVWLARAQDVVPSLKAP